MESFPHRLMNGEDVEFQPSNFFSEQLTAFELWLEHGSSEMRPPEQLPIVLQVLLSQVHRVRALVLLGRFLDMGAWAVDLALSVGIFPYVLKLLQTSAHDLRQTLVFIWTKILALDKTCQVCPCACHQTWGNNAIILPLSFYHMDIKLPSKPYFHMRGGTCTLFSICPPGVDHRSSTTG